MSKDKSGIISESSLHDLKDEVESASDSFCNKVLEHMKVKGPLTEDIRQKT